MAAGGFESPEYRLSNGAVAAGAVRAYEQGATGAGVKIAVIDSGIDPGYVDFLDRIDAASGDVAGARGLGDDGGHGTAVAAVAAAARNGHNQHGVAFGATIVGLRADTPGSCGASTGCAFTDAALAAGVDRARTAGARVINLSIVGDGAGPRLVAAVDAATRAGIIVVVAAGNGGGTAAGAQPEALATGLAQLAGNGLVIIAGSVGSVDANGAVDLSRLSSFSNRAGSWGQTYLTALGARLVAPNVLDGNRPYYWSGTSFSAPVISGAVALLAQAFPNLSGQQIVEILYRTADDMGATGTDDVFGRGRLNLDRAFQPLGATALAGSGGPVSLVSNGQLPPASGDARTASASAVVLDEYKRPFSLNVAATVGAAARDEARLARALASGVSQRAARTGGVALAFTVAERPDGSEPARLGLSADGAAGARLLAGRALARLDDRTAVALGFAEGAKGLERELANAAGAGGFLQAADPLQADAFQVSRDASVALRHRLGALGITVSAERGRASDGGAFTSGRDGYGLMSTTLDGEAGGVRVSVGASQLREAGTVLGGRLAPTLAAAGALTRFLDADLARDFGAGWAGRLLYRRGWTAFADGDGRLESSGWAFELGKAGTLAAGDRLDVRLSQPLRIEDGGLTTRLPDSYDWRTGEVTYAARTLSFVPRGRELAAEAGYRLPLAGGALGLNAFWRRQPGHWRDAAADLGGAVRFGLDF